MRIAIIKSGTFLDQRVKNIFDKGNNEVSIINNYIPQSLMYYNVVVFTHKNNISNKPIIMQDLASRSDILVVYISNSPSIGQLQNIYNHSRFVFIEELKIDISLYDLVNEVHKRLILIKNLEDELRLTRVKQENDKLVLKAKIFLMEKGLNEADSHKLIQKIAMKKRLNKGETANLIIKNIIDISKYS